MAGTSAAGGEEVNNVNAVLQNMVANATAEKKHPKQSLFFTQSHDGQKAAAEFLQRLGIRQLDRDVAHPNSIKKSLDKEPALGTVRILFAAGMRKWKIPF